MPHMPAFDNPELISISDLRDRIEALEAGAGGVVMDPSTIGGDGSVDEPYGAFSVKSPYGATSSDWAHFMDDPSRTNDLVTLYIRNVQNNQSRDEAVTLQVDNNSTHDCTGEDFTAEAIEVQAAGSKSAGSGIFTNIGITSNATGGDENLSFNSQQGDMRQDGAAFFGTVSLLGFTIGPGTVAGVGGIRLNGNVIIEPSNSCSLGNNVAPFILPGSSSLNPSIRVGLSGSSTSAQIATKNTDTGSPECGMNIHCDTTVNATARGGVVIYRSAGGSNEVCGFVVPGSSNHYATGSTENSALIWSYDPGSAGRRIEFATGSAPTVRAHFATGGLFTLLKGLAHNDSLGFYGTTPIAQQTGVAVTAAGIHAALVNLGLITA